MAYDLSIAQLRFTKAQFESTNPVPASGALCVETDSGVYATGDGSSRYLVLRGNTVMDGEERKNADVAYDVMRLSDGRDDTGGGAVGSDDVTNESGVTGATVSDALDALDAAIDAVADTDDQTAAQVPVTPYFSSSSALGQATYRNNGATQGGKPIYELVGGDPDDDRYDWIDLGGGVGKWQLLSVGNPKYEQTTAANTASPALVPAWSLSGDGALPLPVLTPLSAADVQAELERQNAALDTLAQNVSDQGTAITDLTQILPTVYEAIGSSTTASEETNQFVNTFTFTNPIPGRFEITADSGTPFTVGKTRVTVGVASNSNVLIPSYSIVSTSFISFRFYDITGTEADPAVWSIYIRVYP